MHPRPFGRGRSRPREAFTLLELMIAVAIIGVLAATAVTLFTRFQLQARSAEVRSNLAAIRTAEEAYFADSGAYVPAGPYPAPPASHQRRIWVASASGAFQTLGYASEGPVYFTYAVTTSTAGGPAFSVGARGDLDGDGQNSHFAYMAADASGTPPSVFGCASGVYDPSTGVADRTHVVGPCDAVSGRSTY